MNLASILDNQVFAGVAGAAVVSAALFQLRELPKHVIGLLRSQFTATLTVYSEQEAFRKIELWLGQHPSTQSSRRLALVETWDQLSADVQLALTAGEGPHLLWEGKRPILANKTVAEPSGPAGGGFGPRRQTITLTTFGRDRSMLERILADAKSVQDRDVVPVHLWVGHGYSLIERRPRRALDTIYLAPGLREQIVADAERFVDRRAWYVERGIPHRRGYLFEGPPGTGKSTMALALAGALRRPIHIINPATVRDDNELQSAINAAGAGVVLIEDIDAVDCSQDRAPASRQLPAQLAALGPAATASEPTKTGITTSGMLNAIDGVAARDGRILIITSNHPEKLDAALIRPGRVDLRCRFGLADEDQAIAMFRRFCPDDDAPAFLSSIAPDLPLSQAELQNRLLARAA